MKHIHCSLQKSVLKIIFSIFVPRPSDYFKKQTDMKYLFLTIEFFGVMENLSLLNLYN